MHKAFLDLLSKHSLAWLLAIVIVLMIGNTGIERIIDRLLPPVATDEVRSIAQDINAMERREVKLDRLIDNQQIILRTINRMADKMGDGQIERAEITRRLDSLETWRTFVAEESGLVRPSWDRTPYGINP